MKQTRGSQKVCSINESVYHYKQVHSKYVPNTYRAFYKLENKS